MELTKFMLLRRDIDIRDRLSPGYNVFYMLNYSVS